MPPVMLAPAAGGGTIASMGGGRSLTVLPSAGGQSAGLVHAIAVGPVSVLAAPVAFAVEGVTWAAGTPPAVAQSDAMTATLTAVSRSEDGALVLNSTVIVSYDGFVDVALALSGPAAARAATALANASLAFTVAAKASAFFMGLGVEGRNRTAQVSG